MAIWTVYEDPDLDDEDQAERAIFVRDGFHWWAFLFGPLWLIANGMIVVLIAYLAVMGAANTLAVEYLGEAAAGPISFVLAIWFGFEATNLRRWALARRGRNLIAVVEAEKRVDAERRYYEYRLAPDPSAPLSDPDDPSPAPWGPRPPSFAGQPPDRPVLGLFPEIPR
ncbi:MAG: DUF2628 domain-containing protein [Pseudomonadota bacterium]